MSKSVKIEPQPSEDYKALQKQFESICSEMERLYKPTFEKIFEALFKIDSSLNKNYPCTDNESEMKEAIMQAGFGDDEALCKDFIEYNRLFIEGKKIQMQGIELMAQENNERVKIEQQEQQPEGWQFYPIGIVASSELHAVINGIIKSDAEKGKGLFANVTNIPLEDVGEDEFDMVEVYNCQATFTKYFAELKRYGIIGTDETGAFLCKDFKTLTMALLKHLATYIKEHTDQQAATKNEITATIKTLDEIPHWGLFLQILTLQGLCRWLESVNINEGDSGFDEAQALYNWLWEHLKGKIIDLIIKPYSDGDKEILKPLTDYLYSTEVGRLVQDIMFGEPQQISLPGVLDTDKGKELLQRTRDNGFCDEVFNWLKSKALLAYYADKANDYLGIRQGEYDGRKKTSWKPFETLFNVKGLAGARNDYQKTGTLPDGSTDIDLLFN